MNQPTTTIETVTPELALDWLTANTHNRKVRSSWVQRLAQDMSAGRYALSGESIKFDYNGVLLDGQHRLLAQVESEVTLPHVVVRGLDPEAFAVIDIGGVRTSADALHMEGVSDGNVVAAAARSILLYEMFPDQVWDSVNNTITKTQVTQFALENADEIRLMHAYARAWQPGGRRVSVITSSAYLIGRVNGWDVFDKGKGEEFHIGLASGANLDKGSPLLALRNHIINNPSRGGSKWKSQQLMIAIIRTWNDFLLGETRQYLKITRSALPMSAPLSVRTRPKRKRNKSA